MQRREFMSLMAAFARDPNGGLNPVDATALQLFRLLSGAEPNER